MLDQWCLGLKCCLFPSPLKNKVLHLHQSFHLSRTCLVRVCVHSASPEPTAESAMVSDDGSSRSQAQKEQKDTAMEGRRQSPHTACFLLFFPQQWFSKIKIAFLPELKEEPFSSCRETKCCLIAPERRDYGLSPQAWQPYFWSRPS